MIHVSSRQQLYNWQLFPSSIDVNGTPHRDTSSTYQEDKLTVPRPMSNLSNDFYKPPWFDAQLLESRLESRRGEIVKAVQKTTGPAGFFWWIRDLLVRAFGS